MGIERQKENISDDKPTSLSNGFDWTEPDEGTYDVEHTRPAKPTKVFENGPDWEETEVGWECRIGDLFLIIEELHRFRWEPYRYRGFSGIPGRCDVLLPFSDPGTPQECCDWIRERLQQLSFALNEAQGLLVEVDR